MSNLLTISRAYPLNVHNDGGACCGIIVNKKNLLAVIPWSCSNFEAGHIDNYPCGSFTGYLVLVRGYYDDYLKRYNIEKYEIEKIQYEDLVRQIKI